MKQGGAAQSGEPLLGKGAQDSGGAYGSVRSSRAYSSPATARGSADGGMKTYRSRNAFYGSSGRGGKMPTSVMLGLETFVMNEKRRRQRLRRRQRQRRSFEEIAEGVALQDVSKKIVDVRGLPRWRVAAYSVLFKHEHGPGATFSRLILMLIFASVVCFVLSTEASFYNALPWLYDGVETVTVLVFTAEFFFRLATVGVRQRILPLSRRAAAYHRQGSSASKSSSPEPPPKPEQELTWLQEVGVALSWCVSFEGLVDLASIAPWWIEKLGRFEMPTTTPVRIFRVLRILNSREFMGAVKVLARVLYFNKEVMSVAGMIGFLLLLITSTLLYIVNQPGTEGGDGGGADDDFAATEAQFSSVPAAMYLSILMLTGQGEPDGELTTATKVLCVVTAVGSVAV